MRFCCCFVSEIIIQVVDDFSLWPWVRIYVTGYDSCYPLTACGRTLTFCNWFDCDAVPTPAPAVWLEPVLSWLDHTNIRSKTANARTKDALKSCLTQFDPVYSSSGCHAGYKHVLHKHTLPTRWMVAASLRQHFCCIETSWRWKITANALPLTLYSLKLQSWEPVMWISPTMAACS